MFFKSLEIIKELERRLSYSYSLPIFKGYVAIDKRGVEKIIDELYSALPEDVQIARNYLKNNDVTIENKDSKAQNIYDSLKRLEMFFDKSFEIMNITIVPADKAKEIIKKIVESVPGEIFQAKKLNKK